LIPPLEENLVVFENGPNGRENQDDGQHGKQIRDVLVGTGEGLDFFADGHGEVLPGIRRYAGFESYQEPGLRPNDKWFRG
jgi:hypothetical protein